jgi:hypothetical protein
MNTRGVEYQYYYRVEDIHEQLSSSVDGLEMRPIEPHVAQPVFDICRQIISTFQ